MTIKLNTTDTFRLKDGYLVKFQVTPFIPTYKYRVIEVNGEPDDLYGEKFTEDGIAYHSGCGFDVVEVIQSV